VEAVNQLRLPDALRTQKWEPQVSDAALQRVWNGTGKPPARFSHSLSGTNYVPCVSGPGGNAFVFETARHAVRGEQLGRHEVPDFLAINLSTNDYAGHRFGPDSPEILDLTVQTDRELAGFFNFLNEQVPGGLASVTIALSADHGVVPVPELNARGGVPAGRANAPAVVAAAGKALASAVGPGDWIAGTENGDLYFREATAARYPQVPRERLEQIAADAARSVPGVFAAFGKSAVLSGRIPGTALGRRLANGIHPRRSGDLIVILDPQWLAGTGGPGTGTSHGSPFTEDTHVPLLLAGFGVRPGTYLDPVSPARMAPSLSLLLGVSRPSAADEPLLPGLALSP
jgi:hypothetical protein